jgi:hypothetical protein
MRPAHTHMPLAGCCLDVTHGLLARRDTCWHHGHKTRLVGIITVVFLRHHYCRLSVIITVVFLPLLPGCGAHMTKGHFVHTTKCQALAVKCFHMPNSHLFDIFK